MCRGALVVVLAVAACGPDHYGTYLVADGHHARITFDHAEFFFGHGIDGGFASPHLGPQAGSVYERALNDADVAVPASADKLKATYYLPPNKPNADLGDYVLVVAYDAGGVPVGVGEVDGLPTPPTNAIVEVPIALEPATGVEVWGDRPDCVAWQRSTDDLVAVVRTDDHDCDGAPVTTDCNDLSYCTPGDPVCTAKPRQCAGTCTLGCSTGGSSTTCEPTVCLFQATCDGVYCTNATTVAEKLTCLAATGGVDHADYEVPAVSAQPCLDKFDVKLPNGLECTNPRIEFAEMLPDGYTFSVEGDGSSCRIELIPSPTNQKFQGDHHLLVSFEAPDPTHPRYSVFFGVMPLAVMQCTSTVSMTANPLVINMCQ